MAISKALLAKLFKKRVPGMVPILLKISHDSLSNPLFLTDNNEPLVYESETYQPASFIFTFPEQSKDSVGLAKITMGAVDQTLINLIRNLTSPLQIRFAAEYYEDGNFSRLDGFSFQLINVSWNALTFSGDLAFKSLLDMDFPSGEFSSITTPGVA
ncbi:MAG: DUF1833 domain-containing protein [Endomicrobium sp.]|jgi:hypothetical protein|nr:DUF1833 domain-containing protein [Endomicrobium sp.]